MKPLFYDSKCTSDITGRFKVKGVSNKRVIYNQKSI
jgi:hypothetical protein